MMRRFVPSLVLAILFACPAVAQQPCPSSPPLPVVTKTNIFSEEQETYLGDVIAEQFERNFNVVEGDLSAYLQKTADRIVKEMPPSKIPIRVKLVDLPQVNAYAFPGGRIYVTRKMVVAARNEDELAGVIAHEIGHIIARQSSLGMSYLFGEVLGVTSLKDRADVVARYHQLIENANRKPKAFEKERHVEADQIVADTVAMYGVARAGFRPQAYSEFWDRFTENRGKTGNSFSDFFGATKPESRRLREMLSYANTLPASCVSKQTADAEPYKAFQRRVLENEESEHKENLASVLFKKRLEPALRSDIRHIRFSPDGKLVLAQDDATIYVLNRDPLAYSFRIKAKDAKHANFSSDSSRIVFHNDALRVETWDLAAQKRVSVHEIARRYNCLQSKLSNDGKYLGCWNPENVLQLLEVASGDAIFVQKDFFNINTMGDYAKILLSQSVGTSALGSMMSMDFTHDGKIFAVGHGKDTIVYDIAGRKKMGVPGHVRDFMESSFAFTSDNKMLGVPLFGSHNGELMTFPEGKTVAKFSIGEQNVFAPSRGNYAIIRPVKDFPVGVVDLSTNRFLLANSKAALDIYDNHYISERRDGELGLYDKSLPPKQQLVKAASLPRGDLSRVRAFALSPDMKWLAVSERNRGAVWNLETNERVMYLRAFRGAIFTSANEVVLDFPPPELPPDPGADEKTKKEKEDNKPLRQLVNFNLLTRQMTKTREIREKDEDPGVSFLGDIVLVTRGGGRKGKDFARNVTLEVQDPSSGAVMWSRNFPKESPDVYYTPWEGRMMFVWELKSAFAKDEVAADAALLAKVSAKEKTDEDRLIHVVDNKTGKVESKMILKTGEGSFRIQDLDSAGDYVLINDNQNRFLLYSLSSGEIVGRFFGDSGFISSAAKALAIETADGQLSLYRFSDLQNRAAKLDFPSGIAGLRFNPQGKLFVLTDDQTAYAVDLEAAMQAEAKTAAAK